MKWWYSVLRQTANMARPPNKQLERTVVRDRGRAASAAAPLCTRGAHDTAARGRSTARYTARTAYRIGKTMPAFNPARVTTCHRALSVVARAMYLSCAVVTNFAVAGCQDRSAVALTEVLAPP